MKMRNWTKLGVILTGVGVVTSLVFSSKSQNMQNVKTGNNSPIAQVDRGEQAIQTGDNSPVSITNVYNVVRPDAERIRELESELRLLKAYQSPFSDRPKIGIASPSVTFVNYTEDIARGLVKAGLQVAFVNIGGVVASDIKTKWTIYDNGNVITGLDKWIESQGQKPFVITELSPKMNNAFTVFYNPDIGASGVGRLELILDYEYTNSKTGENYAKQYRGFVEYKTEKNNKPKQYLFTPMVQ